jgi:hypothetical protein
MLNSVPNNSKYQQGNFIPTNKDKVIKLNDKGGVYYRSSLELKMMTWLDNSPHVSKWCGECMTIPYQMTHYEKNGDINIKTHTYYPDFYYELSLPDGNIKKMVIEVKPQKEYDYVITGEFGWPVVPQDIQDATRMLINDISCNKLQYVSQYIKEYKTDQFTIKYDDLASSGTGNMLVDKILSQYNNNFQRMGVL